MSEKNPTVYLAGACENILRCYDHRTVTEIIDDRLRCDAVLGNLTV